MSTALLDDKPATPACVEPSTGGIGGKYLTFRLGAEEFGVGILKVREIIGLMEITAVPRMPPHMVGVINLRGSIIPVIDLRTQFGLEQVEHTEQTCIIVVDVGKEIGVIVDAVSEVLDIPETNIEPPPALTGGRSGILGMGKVGAAVKILLDIETVLAGGRGAEPSPPPTAVPAAEPGDTPAAGQAGRFFELPEF